MRPVIIDTHCHLDFNLFKPDRVEVLERAREHGVERIVIPGIDLQSNLTILELVKQHNPVFAAIGFHPNEIQDWQALYIDQLRELSRNSKVVAIGEIGLDYYRKHASDEIQIRAFESQLDFAAEANLPVIVHNRDASQDIFSILENWIKTLVKSGSNLVNHPGVLHSFSGSQEDARRAIEMNFKIGISGPVTFKNAKELQSLVAFLPLESVVIETDAPFLTPHPFRGKRNEPAFVMFVAEKIAQIRGITYEQVAQMTTANAYQLFNWSVN